MIMKKYSEFINESLKDKLTQNKSIVKAFNKIIEDEFQINSISTYTRDKFPYPNRIFNNEKMSPDHNIILHFYIPSGEAINVTDAKRRLNLELDLEIYLIEKEEDYHVNQGYALTFKLDDLLESDLGKSLKGTIKYKL